MAVFGGWAEELSGLIEPRAHSDVDLLLRAAGFAALDAFVAAAPDLVEIPEKRFPHKRAFEHRGVRVELFLVARDADGWPTRFWGTTCYRWPENVWGEEIDGLPVASVEAVTGFRRDHARLAGELSP